MGNDRQDRQDTSEPQVTGSPRWTNPYIGMCALISACINTFGEEGETAMREAMLNLGRKTGQAMIDQGLVPKGASVQRWGKMLEQLLDLTGIHDHQCVESTPERYLVRVNSCEYPEPYEHIKAPPNICEIPIQWDNGCLETVNPEIRMTIRQCIWRGDGYCLYCIDKRQAEA